MIANASLAKWFRGRESAINTQGKLISPPRTSHISSIPTACQSGSHNSPAAGRDKATSAISNRRTGKWSAVIPHSKAPMPKTRAVIWYPSSKSGEPCDDVRVMEWRYVVPRNLTVVLTM